MERLNNSLGRPPAETQVAIVGGGPVGLLMGCLLTLRGVDCVVLERRTGPTPHSRAFGIHPPSLEVLRVAGVADELIRRGVKITGGKVFLDKSLVGRLPLEGIAGVFPFVLSVPQTVTESVLEGRLCKIAPKALIRGVNIVGYVDSGTHTTLRVETGYGDTLITAQYVVACDGKNSSLRTLMGIPFVGGKYPDCYLMGDFTDDTPFGTDAALFVTKGGIVESFPLSGGLRRWVVRLPERAGTADAENLAAIVRERTGFIIPTQSCVWMSPFGIEHYYARFLYQDGIFLAGDAAHVISPIGGQGMNLGFLDAADLANRFPQMLANGRYRKQNSRYDYYGNRIRSAKIALKRAERNTVLGRPCPVWHPNRALIWGMVNIPALRDHFAGVFTMQGLSGR